MYTRLLSIANIVIAVKSRQPFLFSKRCEKFETVFGEPDAVFFVKWNPIIPKGGTIIYDSDICRLSVINNEKYYFYKRDKSNISYLKCLDSNKNEYELGIATIYDNEYVINPLMFVDLATFFIKYNAAILHSSFIAYSNYAILFSAPSQTGKSTQAKLWEKYYNAEIINGDRTLIRKINSNWIAAGSPYAGSSRIYKNKQYDIKAIVILRKNFENKITKLSFKEAYLCLLSELTISPISKNTVELQTIWLLDLVNNIPIYMLSCLPNKEAVDMLKDTLEDL